MRWRKQSTKRSKAKQTLNDNKENGKNFKHPLYRVGKYSNGKSNFSSYNRYGKLVCWWIICRLANLRYTKCVSKSMVSHILCECWRLINWANTISTTESEDRKKKQPKYKMNKWKKLLIKIACIDLFMYFSIRKCVCMWARVSESSQRRRNNKFGIF